MEPIRQRSRREPPHLANAWARLSIPLKKTGSYARKSRMASTLCVAARATRPSANPLSVHLHHHLVRGGLRPHRENLAHLADPVPTVGLEGVERLFGILHGRPVRRIEHTAP